MSRTTGSDPLARWARRAAALVSIGLLIATPACGKTGDRLAGAAAKTAECAPLTADGVPQARVCSPSAGESVGATETVRGLVGGIGGQQLWLVVLAINDRQHPQRQVSPATDGTFAGLAHFGDSQGGAGQEFTLQVVAADSSAAQTFRRYLDAKTNVGIAALPDGATVLTSVTVTRSK